MDVISKHKITDEQMEILIQSYNCKTYHRYGENNAICSLSSSCRLKIAKQIFKLHHTFTFFAFFGVSRDDIMENFAADENIPTCQFLRAFDHPSNRKLTLGGLHDHCETAGIACKGIPSLTALIDKFGPKKLVSELCTSCFVGYEKLIEALATLNKSYHTELFCTLGFDPSGGVINHWRKPTPEITIIDETLTNSQSLVGSYHVDVLLLLLQHHTINAITIAKAIWEILKKGNSKYQGADEMPILYSEPIMNRLKKYEKKNNTTIK